MPVEEVCRLTAESGDRLSIAFVVVRFARAAHAGCSRPRSRSPVDTTVVAVICDERAHPRMQTLSGLAVLTVGTARGSVRPAAAGGDGMSGDARCRQRAGARPAVVPRVLAGAVFAAVIVALAAIAAWPIYRLAAFVAAGRGRGRRRRGDRRARPAPALAALDRRGASTAARSCVLGVPLAVPSRLGGPLEMPAGPRRSRPGACSAGRTSSRSTCRSGRTATCWCPRSWSSSSARALVLLLSWRDDRVGVRGGSRRARPWSPSACSSADRRSAAARARPDHDLAPVETATRRRRRCSSALLWLAWRTHDERCRALQRAAASSGVRVSRRQSRRRRRRTALGARHDRGRGRRRRRRRARSRPAGRARRAAFGGRARVSISPAVSPLAQYRALFADDARRRRAVHRRPARARSPERVRLATLDAYDGEVYRSGGTGAPDAGALRPRAVRARRRRRTSASTSVTIDDLDGIWMPTAGRLASVDFRPRARPSPTASTTARPPHAGVETRRRRPRRTGDATRSGASSPPSRVWPTSAPPAA